MSIRNPGKLLDIIKAEEANDGEPVLCRFWIGNSGEVVCGDPIEPGSRFCAEHSGHKCWCGTEACRRCEPGCGGYMCERHTCDAVTSMQESCITAAASQEYLDVDADIDWSKVRYKNYRDSSGRWRTGWTDKQ